MNLNPKSPSLFSLKRYIKEVEFLCKDRVVNRYTFLPDPAQLIDFGREISLRKILLALLNKKKQKELKILFVKAFDSFCREIINSGKKQLQGVIESYISLLELIHLVDKGFVYAALIDEEYGEETKEIFNKLVRNYFGAIYILRVKYTAIISYLFDYVDDNKIFEAPQKRVKVFSNAADKKAVELARNYALLAYLESSLQDYEILKEEENGHERILLANGFPIYKYTKKALKNYTIYVIELDINIKRALIEEYFRLRPPGVMESVMKKLSSPEQVENLLRTFIKIHPQIKKPKFEENKSKIFALVGPSIETGFRLLLITNN